MVLRFCQLRRGCNSNACVDIIMAIDSMPDCAMHLRMYRKWISESLARSGKTQAGLAKALGLERSQVSKILAGTRKIQIEELITIGDYLGERPPFPFNDKSGTAVKVPVMGVVMGNVWYEPRDDGETQSVDVPPLLLGTFPDLSHYLVKIHDTTDPHPANDEYAICVKYETLGRAPRIGDMVHCQRRRAGLIQDVVVLVNGHPSAKTLITPAGEDVSDYSIDDINGIVISSWRKYSV